MSNKAFLLKNKEPGKRSPLLQQLGTLYLRFSLQSWQEADGMNRDENFQIQIDQLKKAIGEL